MSESALALSRVGRALAGLVLGAVVAAIIMLATVAFRTVVQEIFLHSFGDLVGWVGLPVVLVPAVAVWASFRLSGRAFWLAVALVLGGVVTGILAGASIGAAETPPTSAIWAGGIMGAGAGALLALLVSPVVLTRDTGSEDSGDSTAAASRDGTATAALTLMMVAGGCGPPPAAPGEARTSPAPDPSAVESVVFLLGDSTFGIHTLLKKAGLLIQDVESRPYADLKRRLLNAFADAGRPDLFVGGHEHSLQVFESPETDGGRSMVVGSATS